MKLTIHTIKTWRGKKWAVVDEETKVVQENSYQMLIFPYTREGLQDAKLAKKTFKA